MKTQELTNIKPGDRIKFKAATRYSNETATRVVKRKIPFYVLVGYQGHDEFYVRNDEILDIFKKYEE